MLDGRSPGSCSIWPLAFPVRHPESPGTSQNSMLVALKQEPRSFTSPDPRVQACLDHRWEGTPNREGLLLTDAFAPVDHMVHKASQGEMNLNPFLDQLQQVRRPVPGAR